MQISYAQRLEDYHLSLMFAGEPAGFYVDVGAGHPIVDNVTFWFYLKGWRGLVIEPQADLADAYAHVRPRDHVLQCLVGQADGEADFHMVERLHGFSTMIERNAQGAAAFGAGYQTQRRPVRSLASLVEEHRIAAIDLLKVDVEGAEAQVLAGVDWQKVRPRVVVVEAVAPGTMAETHSEWEPFLCRQGYRFVFFDQLNRFYVADEARALADRLPQAPAAWNVVPHLYEFGRAPEREDHPDHAVAKRLVEGFLAALPSLDSSIIARCLSPSGVDPGALAAWIEDAIGGRSDGSGGRALAALLDSDAFKAALGRIAAGYDGGFVDN